MKGRLHVIIAFTVYLTKINQTLFICGQSQAAAGEMISIEGLTIVWYTLTELRALDKFLHICGIKPKFESY